MGIFLLKNWVGGNIAACSYVVSLTELAGKSERGRITLVVDGWGLVCRCMEELVSEGVVRGWEWAQGGDYELFHERLRDTVESLRAGKVDIVVFFDPARGSMSANDQMRKVDELSKRRDRRRENYQRALVSLSAGLPALKHWESEVGPTKIWEMPTASGWQAKCTLASLGVEVVVLEKEADGLMVHEMERRGAFAILGDDTDFLAMKGSSYIQYSDLVFTKQYIYARVFTPERVAAALGIPERRLYELAVICGNDITGTHVAEVAKALSLPTKSLNLDERTGVTPASAANFLRMLDEGQDLAGHPQMVEIMRDIPRVAETLQECKDFYNNVDREDVRDEGPLVSHVAEAVRSSKAPGWALGVVLHGKMACKLHVERDTDQASFINLNTRPLRCAVYTLLGREAVTESLPMAESEEVAALPGDLVERATGTSGLLGLMGLLEKPRSERWAAYVQIIELGCGNEPSSVDPLASVPEFHDFPNGVRAPLREIARVLRYVAHVSDQTQSWEKVSNRKQKVSSSKHFEAAALTALLLHAGADAMKLSARDSSYNAAVFSSLFLECSDLMSGVSSLIMNEAGGSPSAFEPRMIFSARLFVHALTGSKQVQTMAEQVGVTPQVVTTLLRHLPLWNQTTTDASPREAAPCVGNTLPKESQSVQATWDRAVEADGPTTGPEAVQVMGSPPALEDALPIEAFREVILERVRVSEVTTINGQTGCGKSSMVPKYLVDDALERGERVSVVVCQPRRIAAVSLAKRVARLYGEEVGGTVGYRVGQGDRAVGTKTKVTYVTVGWLLQHLSFNPEDLGVYTHLVLDEVHERSLDGDLLCLLLKKQMQMRANMPKLIVMSATLQAELFGRYFLREPEHATQQGPAAPSLPLDGHEDSNGQGGHIEGLGVVEPPTEGADEQAAGLRAPAGGSVDPSKQPEAHTDGKTAVIDACHVGLDPSGNVSMVSSLNAADPPDENKPVEAAWSQEVAPTAAAALPAQHSACDAIFVGARRFPVKVVHLDQIIKEYPSIQGVGYFVNKACSRFKELDSHNSVAATHLAKDHLGYDIKRLIIELLGQVAVEGSCVLIFLPGISEIINLRTTIESSTSDVPLQIVLLHSLVPDAEQAQAINSAIPGHCKVILATNIAETSVTIPDVSVIIDSGLHRKITYDQRRRLQILQMTWICRASGEQRAGRAGRVAPGTVIRLYTECFKDKMLVFDDPEIMRTTLETTVLRVKMIMPSGYGSVSALLAETLSPPRDGNVAAAVNVLYEQGALVEDHEDSMITDLGRAAIEMPVDLKLVKLLMLGRAFGALNECIVMATAVSMVDIFMQPSQIFIRDPMVYASTLRRSLKARVHNDDGECSDPMAMLSAYKAWILTKRDDVAAHRLGLSAPKMQLLCAQVAYMASKMSGFLSRSTGSADYHKEAEGQAYGAVEQGRGAESEFDHKQLDLLMKLSMKHKVSTQAEVSQAFPCQADTLRVLLFGAMTPEIILAKAGSMRQLGQTSKTHPEGAKEKEQAGRTIAFKVLEKRFYKKNIIAGLFAALGMPVEKASLCNAKKLLASVVFSPSPAKDRRGIVDDLCFNGKLVHHLCNQGKHRSHFGVPWKIVRDAAATVILEDEDKEVEEAAKEADKAKLAAEGSALAEGEVDGSGGVVEAQGGGCLPVLPEDSDLDVFEEFRKMFQRDDEQLDDQGELALIDDENTQVSIQDVRAANRLHWSFEKDQSSVFISRSSPLNFLSDMSMGKGDVRMAVVSSLLGSASTVISVSGVTILPRGLYPHILRLTFQPRDQKAITRFQVVDGIIVGYSIKGTDAFKSRLDIKWNLSGHAFTLADLRVMNRVRDVASKAITNVAGTKLEKKETIKAMLSCLIAIAKKELVVEEARLQEAAWMPVLQPDDADRSFLPKIVLGEPEISPGPTEHVGGDEEDYPCPLVLREKEPAVPGEALQEAEKLVDDEQGPAKVTLALVKAFYPDGLLLVDFFEVYLALCRRDIVLPGWDDLLWLKQAEMKMRKVTAEFALAGLEAPVHDEEMGMTMLESVKREVMDALRVLSRAEDGEGPQPGELRRLNDVLKRMEKALKVVEHNDVMYLRTTPLDKLQKFDTLFWSVMTLVPSIDEGDCEPSMSSMPCFNIYSAEIHVNDVCKRVRERVKDPGVEALLLARLDSLLEQMKKFHVTIKKLMRLRSTQDEMSTSSYAEVYAEEKDQNVVHAAEMRAYTKAKFISLKSFLESGPLAQQVVVTDGIQAPGDVKDLSSVRVVLRDEAPCISDAEADLMRVMYKLHVPLNNSSTLPAFYRCGKLNMLELVTIMESWNHKQREIFSVVSSEVHNFIQKYLKYSSFHEDCDRVHLKVVALGVMPGQEPEQEHFAAAESVPSGESCGVRLGLVMDHCLDFLREMESSSPGSFNGQHTSAALDLDVWQDVMKCMSLAGKIEFGYVQVDVLDSDNTSKFHSIQSRCFLPRTNVKTGIHAVPSDFAVWTLQPAGLDSLDDKGAASPEATGAGMSATAGVRPGCAESDGGGAAESGSCLLGMPAGGSRNLGAGVFQPDGTGCGVLSNHLFDFGFEKRGGATALERTNFRFRGIPIGVAKQRILQSPPKTSDTRHQQHGTSTRRAVMLGKSIGRNLARFLR